MNGSDNGPATDEAPPRRFTVLGLFEDAIDAEQALSGLRKAERPAEHVSVLVRDRAADGGGRVDRHGEVGRAVVASALSAVSGWLLGLAALIVPEHGTYLVAGPLGAALAGIRPLTDPSGDAAGAASPSAHADSIGPRAALVEFGFRLDEATYIEHRVTAGSVVVAFTTSDETHLQETRRLFANHSAVHIGQAQTLDIVARETEAQLSAAPEQVAASDVVIADAVAPLLHLCGGDHSAADVSRLCNLPVVDRHGEPVGEVDQVLVATPPTPDASPILRYYLIGHGGVLGLGRRRVVVPASQVTSADDRLQLTIDKEVLRRAPEHQPDVPFSRREEMAVNGYFGATPYWLESP